LSPGEPLKSWGFCILEGCLDEQTVRNFAGNFVQIYIGHGGAVALRNPPILRPPPKTDLAMVVQGARNNIGNATNLEPQIIFFVMPGRDSFVYERLKKNMECRFAMVSQCEFSLSSLLLFN
jgi:eukaryotic translation initiation factor 2C